MKKCIRNLIQYLLLSIGILAAVSNVSHALGYWSKDSDDWVFFIWLLLPLWATVGALDFLLAIWAFAQLLKWIMAPFRNRKPERYYL